MTGAENGFERAWRRFHPRLPPVGYRLRLGGARHWVRFHALPGSQRYAETEAERRIVLARANQLAAEVLGEGGDCWLAQLSWDTSADEVGWGEKPFEAGRALGLRPAFQIAPEPNDDDESGFQVNAARFRWSAGAFDPLLGDIAADAAAPTLWMAAETGAVFAPYDGGFDLFLPSAAHVGRMRAGHAAWLSRHPEGL